MNKLCYIFNTETQSYQLKEVPSHVNVIYQTIQETPCKQNQNQKNIKSSSLSTNSWVDSLYSEYYSDSN